eukprot:scpid79222/ scgid5377/ Pleckstrin homology domain-containing family A member 1; Tandem PH domain-containing protein 1
MTPEETWLCSGFLAKESKGDNWNKRFFVLDETSLKYYKKKPTDDDPEGSVCRGEIRIKKIISVQPTSVWNGKEWCFELKMSHGIPTIFLVAASHMDMEDWMDNITTHPLFGFAARGSVDEAPGPGAPSCYQTKVVGGVVIRTQIISSPLQPSRSRCRRHSTPESDTLDSPMDSSPSAKSIAGDCHKIGLLRQSTSHDGGIIRSSISTNSISNWTPKSTNSSPQRAHRKDGARVVMRGYCTKQGGRRRTWRRRFFILDPFGLAYYQNSWTKDPIKNIPLPLLMSVSDCQSFPDRAHVLQVITVGRIFYMQADSENECQEWIRAIKSMLPNKSEVDPSALPPSSPTTRQRMANGKYAQQLVGSRTIM